MFPTLSFKKIFFVCVMFWLISHTRLSDARREKHFIYFKYTVLTRADTFPEFSAVGVYDKKQISHYSNEERVWILTDKDWTEAPEDPPDSRNWFLHEIRTLSNCTDSLCSELHVLQRIIGCELEKLSDGSVNLTVFDEYGFDGEDLISFNYDTMKWIDKNPKAKETKVEWNSQTRRNMYLKHYLKTCMKWISTFNCSKNSSPDVYMFARKAPDDESKLVLICLATGFYPRDVQMNIRLNKINLEDQTSSGIRPNANETFQMRISVKIDKKHEGSYDCLITHSSLTEPVTVNWDGTCIYCETDSPWIVKAAAAAVPALALPVFGYSIYKRRRSNAQKAMTEEKMMMTEKQSNNHPLHRQMETVVAVKHQRGLNDPGLTDYCEITL